MILKHHSANSKVRIMKIAIGGAVLLGLGAGRILWNIKPTKLKVVDQIDWEKFQGTWYEIARNPVSVERKSFSNITFEYKNKIDQKFDVDMRYITKEGYLGQLSGEAKFLNSPNNSKFEIRYLPSVLRRLRKTQCGVLHIDPDYQVVIIGSFSRKKFWLLSREPKLNQQYVDNYLELVSKSGYNLNDVIMVKHI